MLFCVCVVYAKETKKDSWGMDTGTRYIFDAAEMSDSEVIIIKAALMMSSIIIRKVSLVPRPSPHV